MVPRLSVLDQSPVGADFTPADALRASVDVAQAAEERGFVRYWVAEHHGSPGFAGSAPGSWRRSCWPARAGCGWAPAGCCCPATRP